MRALTLATLLIVPIMGAAFAAPPSLPVPLPPLPPVFPAGGGDGGNNTTGDPGPGRNGTQPDGNQTQPGGNQTQPGGNQTVPPASGNNTTAPPPDIRIRLIGPSEVVAGRTYLWTAAITWAANNSTSGNVTGNMTGNATGNGTANDTRTIDLLLDPHLGVGGTAHAPYHVVLQEGTARTVVLQATLDVTDLPGGGGLWLDARHDAVHAQGSAWFTVI